MTDELIISGTHLQVISVKSFQSWLKWTVLHFYLLYMILFYLFHHFDDCITNQEEVTIPVPNERKEE